VDWTAEPVLALAQGLLERRQQVVLGVPADSQSKNWPAKPVSHYLKAPARSPFSPSSWLQDVCTLRAFLRRTAVDVLHTHLSHDHWLALSP